MQVFGLATVFVFTSLQGLPREAVPPKPVICHTQLPKVDQMVTCWFPKHSHGQRGILFGK